MDNQPKQPRDYSQYNPYRHDDPRQRDSVTGNEPPPRKPVADDRGDGFGPDGEALPYEPPFEEPPFFEEPPAAFGEFGGDPRTESSAMPALPPEGTTSLFANYEPPAGPSAPTPTRTRNAPRSGNASVQPKRPPLNVENKRPGDRRGIFGEGAPRRSTGEPPSRLRPEMVGGERVAPRTKLPPSSNVGGSLAAAARKKREEEERIPQRVLDASLQDLRSGHVDLIGRLLALGLTTLEAETLMRESANNRVVKTALDRLVGMASILHDGSSADEEATQLRQLTGAGRGLPANILPVRFQHNLPEEAELQERLKEAALGLSLIPSGFNLAPPEGGGPAGRPKVLGRVAALGLWFFQPLRRSGATEQASRQYEGSGLEFINKILGTATTRDRRRHRRSGYALNEYVVVSLQVQSTETVGEHNIYVLAPVVTAGDEPGVRVPSTMEDTKYRVVQGILDGLQVEDSRQPDNPIMLCDGQGYTPMLLTRNYVPRRKGARVRENEQVREIDGVKVARDSAGIYYVEPAWMAGRYGLFAKRGNTSPDVLDSMDRTEMVRQMRLQQEQRFAENMRSIETRQVGGPVGPTANKDALLRRNWY